MSSEESREFTQYRRDLEDQEAWKARPKLLTREDKKRDNYIVERDPRDRN